VFKYQNPINWEKIQFSFISVTCALSRKEIANYLQVMAVSLSSALAKNNFFLFKLDFAAESIRCS